MGRSPLSTLNHDDFMSLALEQAKTRLKEGARPIYCLIVKEDGRIVGGAGNTVSRDMDPSAHAEVNAIRDACSRLGTTDLSGCTLYTPMEPCPMCLSTILEAKIPRLVLGARHRRVGRKDLGDYSVESFLALTRRQLDVVVGVREQECERLRLAWSQSHSLD